MNISILNKVRSFVTAAMQHLAVPLKFIIKFVLFYFLFKKISELSFFTGEGLFNETMIQLVLAGVATILPNRAGVLIALAIYVYNIALTSIPGAVLIGLMLLLLYVLTTNLFPDQTFLIVLVPYFISIKWYLAVPMFAGMYMGIGALVPSVMGVLVYGVIQITPAFLNLALDGAMDQIPSIIANASTAGLTEIATNQQLRYLLVFYAVLILLIFALKLFEFNYARYVAIGVSGIFGVIYLVMGVNRGNINGPVSTVVIGSVVVILALLAFEFFKISANYKEARSLEFEDDDYLYKVRMIPKLNSNLTKDPTADPKSASVKQVVKEHRKGASAAGTTAAAGAKAAGAAAAGTAAAGTAAGRAAGTAVGTDTGTGRRRKPSGTGGQRRSGQGLSEEERARRRKARQKALENPDWVTGDTVAADGPALAGETQIVSTGETTVIPDTGKLEHTGRRAADRAADFTEESVKASAEDMAADEVGANSLKGGADAAAEAAQADAEARVDALDSGATVRVDTIPPRSVISDDEVRDVFEEFSDKY